MLERSGWGGAGGRGVWGRGWGGRGREETTGGEHKKMSGPRNKGTLRITVDNRNGSITERSCLEHKKKTVEGKSLERLLGHRVKK